MIDVPRFSGIVATYDTCGRMLANCASESSLPQWLLSFRLS